MAACAQQCGQRAAQLRRAAEVGDDGTRERARPQRDLGYGQNPVAELAPPAAAGNRPVHPHSKGHRARARRAGPARRRAQLAQRLPQGQHWVRRAQQRGAHVNAEHAQRAARRAQVEQANATQRAPMGAEFRLDGGLGTGAKLVGRIEWGYEVYTQPYSVPVTERLRQQVTAPTGWTKVGGNAAMVGGAAGGVGDCPYPLDGAVERFYTGDTQRYGSWVHYGSDPELTALAGWFAEYNGRQTLEAGSKEGKSVFQLHHRKVRAQPGL